MQYICEEHFQNMAGNSLFTGLKGKTHFGRPNFEMFFQAISNKHPKVNIIHTQHHLEALITLGTLT